MTTPYGIVYDGIKPMCFDFDRWGRKAPELKVNEGLHPRPYARFLE